MCKMEVNLAGLILKNPVMTASGTFGYGREYAHVVPLRELGAVVVKGTTLLARDGNPPPRVVETPAGMLNAIGLQNVGVDAFLRDELPFLRDAGATVVLNLAGHTVKDYEEATARVDGAPGLHAIEVNISCPNVSMGGMAFGVSPKSAYEVVAAVRKRTALPVIAKLSPNVTDIKQIATAVVEAGADAVSLINTLVGMAIDVDARQPVLKNVTGGLSGPAVRPVAVRMVWDVCSCVDVPVVGIGGISTARDALEFIMAGASAVQVGTAMFREPTAPLEVIKGIGEYLTQNSLCLEEIVGIARRSA